MASRVKKIVHDKQIILRDLHNLALMWISHLKRKSEINSILLALSSGLAVAHIETCLIDQLHTMLTALVIELSAMLDDNIKLYVVAGDWAVYGKYLCHGERLKLIELIMRFFIKRATDW